MAEIKITCPCCLDSKQCFEEKVDIENFSSFICFNCGFMSNTLYTNDSDALKKLKESTSELMNEISFYDSFALDLNLNAAWALKNRQGCGISNHQAHPQAWRQA